MPDEEIPRDPPQERDDRRDESPVPAMHPSGLQTPQGPSEPDEQSEEWPEVGGPPAQPVLSIDGEIVRGPFPEEWRVELDAWREVEGLRRSTAFEWPGLRSI